MNNKMIQLGIAINQLVVVEILLALSNNACLSRALYLLLFMRSKLPYDVQQGPVQSVLIQKWPSPLSLKRPL